jgi:predicted ATPase
MSFFKNRIGKNGLYFFDEPETALSFDNQILFLFLLKQFENNKNQIFIVTHSPVLLSYPNAQIIEIKKDNIKNIKFEIAKNIQI